MSELLKSYPCPSDPITQFGGALEIFFTGIRVIEATNSKMSNGPKFTLVVINYFSKMGQGSFLC